MHVVFQTKKPAAACSAVIMAWRPQKVPFQKSHTFLQKKKSLQPTARRKQLLGLPIHTRMPWISMNIDYYTLLVLNRVLFRALYCPVVVLWLPCGSFRITERKSDETIYSGYELFRPGYWSPGLTEPLGPATRRGTARRLQGWGAWEWGQGST